MNTVLDTKKKEAKDGLRKLIFEEDEDPFGISTTTINGMERAKAVSTLEDGLTIDNSMRKELKNNEVVHLISETGDVKMKLNSSSKQELPIQGVNHRTVVEEVIDGKKKKKERTKEFWEMNTPEVTPEVKRELEILNMRGYWDPKAFFKGNRTKKELPKEFEFGTVISGNFDTRKSRLTRREKKASFADELAEDIAFKNRADKYILEEKAKRSRPKHKKRASDN